MRNLLFVLTLLALALPTSLVLAGDCTVINCNCVGIIYQDPNLSAPGDLTTRKMTWENAGGEINRNVQKLNPILMLIFYNQFDVSSGPNTIDNLDALLPWEVAAVTFIPASGPNRDQLSVSLYDSSPVFSQIDTFEAGDANNGATNLIGEPLSVRLQFTALLGTDSGPLDLSDDNVLIQRAIDNQQPGLISDVLANGC